MGNNTFSTPLPEDLDAESFAPATTVEPHALVPHALRDDAHKDVMKLVGEEMDQAPGINTVLNPPIKTLEEPAEEETKIAI